MIKPKVNPKNGASKRRALHLRVVVDGAAEERTALRQRGGFAVWNEAELIDLLHHAYSAAWRLQLERRGTRRRVRVRAIADVLRALLLAGESGSLKGVGALQQAAHDYLATAKDEQTKFHRRRTGRKAIAGHLRELAWLLDHLGQNDSTVDIVASAICVGEWEFADRMAIRMRVKRALRKRPPDVPLALATALTGNPKDGWNLLYGHRS